MSIPGSASPLFFQTAAADAAAFQLQKSVRFNSADSAYLGKTFSSAGSTTTWTLSFWIKRAKLGRRGILMSYNGSSIAEPDYANIQFNSSDQLEVGYAYATYKKTDRKFRDLSSWYHIVVRLETGNSTASDRVQIYVNGVKETSFASTHDPDSSQSLAWNKAHDHRFGSELNQFYNDCYFADTYFIDGTALDADSFGEFDDNGVWQAKDASGLTFGTNGFHLFDFANESGIGNDSSGNDNDFTVNNLVDDQATTGVSRIWSSGDSDWSITGSGRYATKSSTGQYADVFTNLLSPGTLYGFTVDIPDGDDNGGWFFGDSNSTSLSGTHPNQGRGSNSIGMRGRASGHSEEGEVGVHGTFASANGVTASNNALTGFESVNPEGAISLDFVVDRSNHKVWVKLSSSSSWVKGGNPTDSSSTPSFSIPSTGDLYFGFIQHDAQTNLDITQFSISQSADADTDVMRDVPTNGSADDDTGAGGEVSGNYATLNPLHKLGDVSLANGNLDVSWSGSNGHSAYSTIAISSGKFYWEFTVSGTTSVGIYEADSAAGNWPGIGSDSFGYAPNGQKVTNSSYSSYGTAHSSGDVVGVAFDADNGKLYFSLNGTWQNSSDPENGTNPAFTGLTASAGYYAAIGYWNGGNSNSANFGQRSWAYSAPSGYSPICTTLLPTPTIADGSAYFDVKLYEGNGTGASSTQAITGFSFSPEFVWAKARSVTAASAIYDTVRGVTQRLASSKTAVYNNEGYFESFDSNGFTVKGNSNNINADNETYVAWCWDAGSSTVSNTDGDITSQVRASQTTGFSIVSYTGSGTSNDSVGHGLNAAPELIITKNRDGAYSWRVLTTAIDGSLDRLFLDANNTKADQTGVNVPTSSVFYVGSNLDHNKSGDGIIAYCISSVAGYSAVNSYSGNGNVDGPFIFTGFRPRWIMIKRTDSTNNWVVYDTARDTYNIGGRRLYTDFTDGENQNTSHYIDILSNGFKVRSDAGNLLNAGSGTYLYVAFAENPFQANGGLAR